MELREVIKAGGLVLVAAVLVVLIVPPIVGLAWRFEPTRLLIIAIGLALLLGGGVALYGYLKR